MVRNAVGSENGASVIPRYPAHVCLSCLIESGDAFVFGGPARLRFHGVSRIIAPPARTRADGRFHLTLRQYDV